MLITSVYADVKRGIRDLGVFDVPEDCLVLTLDDFAVKKVLAKYVLCSFNSLLLWCKLCVQGRFRLLP